MTTDIKLDVPPEAIGALIRDWTPDRDDVRAVDTLRAATTPVIAAKLHELADRIDKLFPEGHPWRDGARYAAAEVRHEVMEIEGECT